MNNLPKLVTQLLPRVDLNPRPVDRKSNALPVAPPRHLIWGIGRVKYKVLSKFKAINKK